MTLPSSSFHFNLNLTQKYHSPHASYFTCLPALLLAYRDKLITSGTVEDGKPVKNLREPKLRHQITGSIIAKLQLNIEIGNRKSVHPPCFSMLWLISDVPCLRNNGEGDHLTWLTWRFSNACGMIVLAWPRSSIAVVKNTYSSSHGFTPWDKRILVSKPLL